MAEETDRPPVGEIDALRQRVAVLEAEQARLQRVETELRGHLRGAALLTRVATLLALAADMTDALEKVCGELARFLHVPQAGFAVLDSERTAARVIADYHPPGSPAAMGTTIPVTGNPSMAVILEHQEPLAIADAQTDPLLEPVHAIMRQRGVQSILIVPVLAGGQVIGTLGFDAFQRRVFSQAEIDLVQDVANYAGSALMRVLQEEERREREAFLALLNDITRAALETDDLSTMLQALADRLGEVIGADGCYLTLWDDVNRRVLPGAAYGAFRTAYPSMEVVPGETTMTESVLEAGGPLVVNDVYDTPYLSRRIAELFPDRSLLGLPLVAGERKLGAALIAFNELHQFTRLEVERCEQAAAHIALALAKAQLVDRLESEVAARTAEIVAEKEKSETILRSVGDAIALIDLSFRVQFVNQAFCAGTGYTADEALGKSIHDLIAGPMAAAARQPFLDAISKGQPWQGEVILRRKDGRTYDAALVISPVVGAQGELLAYVSSHHDISQQKKLEQARTRFMTHVSHELRTPVASVKLYAQMLAKGVAPATAKRYLQVLEEQADRLGRLIQDVLEITAIDGGQAITTREPLSLQNLVGDVVARLQGRAQAAGLTVTVQPLPPEPTAVQGDPLRLTQALGRVVENAVAYTPAGGAISIQVGMAAADERQWVTIAVRDTGPGLAPEELERVFDRFYRGSLAESGHVPGSGLGLSIAQAILQAHGGRITVTSAPGEGSTFTLWLAP